jgi:hypothetical protein
MAPPLPGLLLLGAPKSGTTTLAGWWDEHPQGFTAPEKEVGFFTVEWFRGLEWYRSRFAGAAPGQVACDASPGYMYDPRALDRIAEVLPDARLAVVLREPVSRVWSHWCYMVALGLEPRPFEQVLQEEAADEWRTPPGFPIGYLHGSHYVTALRDIEARFDRSRLLVLLTDELRSDPAGTFARLCEHAGVAPAEPGEDANVGSFPKDLVRQQRLHRMRASRWPLGVGRRLMRANLGGSPPPLAPEHRARLHELLDPLLPPLEEWLGRPLPAGWH